VPLRPRLVQDARVPGPGPSEVRPDEHRGDLEDQLIEVAVARENPRGASLSQGVREPLRSFTPEASSRPRHARRSAGNPVLDIGT
jgi:hypothetical protein